MLISNKCNMSMNYYHNYYQKPNKHKIRDAHKTSLIFLIIYIISTVIVNIFLPLLLFLSSISILRYLLHTCTRWYQFTYNYILFLIQSMGQFFLLIAASVNTLVVSLERCCRQERVCCKVMLFVIPKSTLYPFAGSFPSSSIFYCISIFKSKPIYKASRQKFCIAIFFNFTRFSICLTITSICLSLISTPCRRYTLCTSCII